MTDNPLQGATLRIARPTDRMAEVTAFYRDALGLSVLSSFENHAGFDGVILGSPNAPHHLEFTRSHEQAAGDAPGEEHLLVFYLPDKVAWAKAVARLRRHGHHPVPAANPYWEREGLTFDDPDGYRVVHQHAPWPP